jgi:hypothetical protein
MKQNEVIETIGSITKMENLLSFEEDVLPNSLVLKNIDPFPGYQTKNKNSNIGNKPGSVFIILRYRYAPEKINHINRDLIASRITDCHPSYGEIITRESILPCIRIKHIENYSLIPIIQNFYKRSDLKLMDHRHFSGPGRIKIFKAFCLTEIAEGLYRDLNEGEKIYIHIPHSINWKRFEHITKKIKYHIKNPNFDAALGVIYRFCGPEDVVRIYDQEKTLERAVQLRKLYVKEIKSDLLISASYDHSD